MAGNRYTGNPATPRGQSGGVDPKTGRHVTKDGRPDERFDENEDVRAQSKGVGVLAPMVGADPNTNRPITSGAEGEENVETKEKLWGSLSRLMSGQNDPASEVIVDMLRHFDEQGLSKTEATEILDSLSNKIESVRNLIQN